MTGAVDHHSSRFPFLAAILGLGVLGGLGAMAAIAEDATVPPSSTGVNLLASLQPADLARIRTNNASVFLDSSSRALTLTFRYTNGESEVRLPVSSLGWPVDWSRFKAIQFTFLTTSFETLAIGFSEGQQPHTVQMEALPGIRIQGVIPFNRFLPSTAGWAPPLGYFSVVRDRPFTFEKVEEVVFRRRYPNQPEQLTLYDLTLTESVAQSDIVDKKPLFDRYGQWIPENWAGKAHNDTDLRRMWEEDGLKPVEYPFCPLGGDPTRSARSTGFFRVEKIEGRWAFIDPHGHPFFSTGMDLVSHSYQSSAVWNLTGGEYLFEELPPAGPAWLEGDPAKTDDDPAAYLASPSKVVSFYKANIMRRHGEDWDRKWNEHAIERLKNWGFNSLGAYPDRKLLGKMPYTYTVEGWRTKKTFRFLYDFPDVFSEEFEGHADFYAKTQCAPLKDDPALLGWFVGNEPPWTSRFATGESRRFADALLADPEPSATKARLEELLAANPSEAEKIKEGFLYTAGQKYYKTVTNAIRRHDPNHLVLGTRFEYPDKLDDRWLVIGRIFDVLSANIYAPRDAPATFAPDPDEIRRYARLSGRPVLIGEFSVGTPGRGLAPIFNFLKVRNHAERGKAYRHYMAHAAANPDIVGAYWFQLIDYQPPGYNYGFVNVIDLPYPDLVNAAKGTHRRVYGLMFGRVEPFSEKPRYN